MGARIIDLTMTYEKGMRGVDYSPSHRFEVEGWNARNLQLYSHAGTHMDAPKHFNSDGPTIDCMPLDRCMGEAWIVDLPGLSDSHLITVRDLGQVASLANKGSILLFRTGWSGFVSEEKYRNGLPRISMELANWLVEKGIKLIGVEPPSVADVNNAQEVTDIHQTLFKGNVVIVEGLTNLDQITKQRVQFYALPLKIKDGDGAPCRAFAIEID